MARMTKTSKENLLVADKLQIVSVTFEDSSVAFMVRITKGGKMAYLSDSEGPINYKSISQARRTVKRIRPDLEPTTI